MELSMFKKSGPNGLASGQHSRGASRTAAVLGGVVLATGITVGIAPSAFPHTPGAEGKCVADENHSEVNISATSYDTGGVNRAKIWADGVLVYDQPFNQNNGAGTSFSYDKLTATEAHTWEVRFIAYNDADPDGDGFGDKGWTKKFTGTIASCVTPPVTPPPPPPPPTNPAMPTGAVSTNCTGRVAFTMNTTKVSGSSTFVSTLGGNKKPYTVAGDTTVTKYRQGKPGQIARLFAPNGTKLDEVKVPKPCAVRKPKASLKVYCTGSAVANLNNKASNRDYTFGATTSQRSWANGWKPRVKAHKARRFDFGGRRFPVGTVVKVRYSGKVIKATIPPRCDGTPDAGMRQAASKKASNARLIIPALDVNARVVTVRLTKGGAPAVTHSLSDVFQA